MELIFKTIDNIPVKLTFREHKTCGMFEHYLLTKIEKLDKLPELNQSPEWLTFEVRADVKNIWDNHVSGSDDHLRVEAIRYLQKIAAQAGYKIDMKKAMEIFREFCDK